MKLIKKSLFVLFSFVLIVSGIFIADANAKSKKVQAATNNLPSEVWKTSGILSFDSSNTSGKMSLTASKISIVTSSGVKYDSKKKKWIAFHKINQMIGRPTSVTTSLKI